VFGVEKLVYGLHQSAFVSSIDLWSNNEQREYWKNYMYINKINKNDYLNKVINNL
jgi:hypothetical protein